MVRVLWGPDRFPFCYDIPSKVCSNAGESLLDSHSMSPEWALRQSIPLALASWNATGIDFRRSQQLCSGCAAHGDPPVLFRTQPQAGFRIIRLNSRLGSSPRARDKNVLNHGITLHQNKRGSGLGSCKNQGEERRGPNRGDNGARHQKSERYPGAN